MFFLMLFLYTIYILKYMFQKYKYIFKNIHLVFRIYKYVFRNIDIRMIIIKTCLYEKKKRNIFLFLKHKIYLFILSKK